jgi:exopolyphosphatase/guanosine-5'-triphosphate,3'-diphosphate pyrophosphatase
LARCLDPEPEHAFQVARLALTLFDATPVLHGLDEEARPLLEAGALLHDIGHARNPAGHHKHSRDMILEAQLPGFADTEQRVVACVARYHRKAHPNPGHKIYASLEPAEQDVVQRLAALLRVADGLDRAHACAASLVTVECRGQEVRMTVDQRRPSPLDIWGAMRKRNLFERIFGVRLTVVARVPIEP